MFIWYRILGCLTLFMFASNASAIGDIAQGKAKAVACIACHGVNGITAIPTFPNLAGQKQTYLITAIESYRNNKRNNPAMKAITSTLSVTDIENLSAYFANQPRK